MAIENKPEHISERGSINAQLAHLVNTLPEPIARNPYQGFDQHWMTIESSLDAILSNTPITESLKILSGYTSKGIHC